MSKKYFALLVLLVWCFLGFRCTPSQPIVPRVVSTATSTVAPVTTPATVRPSVIPVSSTPVKTPVSVTAEILSRSYPAVFLARVVTGGGSIILKPTGGRDVFDVTSAGVYRQYEAEGLRMDAVDPKEKADELRWVVASHQGVCLIPDAYVNGHMPGIPSETGKIDVSFRDTCWGVLLSWKDNTGRRIMYVDDVEMADPFARSATGYVAVESGVAYVNDGPWNHANDQAIWLLAGRIANPQELTGPQTECKLLRAKWFPALTETAADTIASLCPGMTVDERYRNTNIIDSMGAYTFIFSPAKPKVLTGKQNVGSVTVEDTGPLTEDPSKHLIRLTGNGITILVPVDRNQYLVFVPYGQHLLGSLVNSPNTREKLAGTVVFALAGK